MSVSTMAVNPTRLAHLVTSNCLPSEAEAEQARGAIADALQELERVTDEISKLEQRRKELNEHIHAHKGIVSPWRRLLPELVIEIMRYCTTSKLYPSQHPEFENPFTIGQVCSAWRDIALSAPSLWANVDIKVSTLSTQSQAEALERLLQRSYPHCLELEVEYQPLQLQLQSPAPLQVIQTIRKFSQRWRSLDIRLTGSLLEALVSSTSLPNLESLILRSSWVYDPYPPPQTHECLPRGVTFRNAPTLRKLNLVNTYLNTATIIDCFPLEQLTDLDIFVGRINRPTQFSGVHTARLLSRTPNLQTYRLSSVPESCLSEDYAGSALMTKPVLLPHLHTLELQTYDRWSSIFDNLALPDLQNVRLEVSSSSWANRWLDDPFDRLLERSQRAKISCDMSASTFGTHVHQCVIGRKAR
ncbi:hypothetical protein NEOLEDRAFT_696457 [Neolentinus lepideus HHB14362 ss-1]|uniref:F-box domain-containing protein n=1 Tax=Neolentinus lepideus HHB14362 ss-1 TaxID=1314782 RepID=A0A165V2R8_9AGAM|nr:hypothetical protein NEOLEDRAFT_696457 [Neolentinus lepideus HHB14362 ss-1]